MLVYIENLDAFQLAHLVAHKLFFFFFEKKVSEILLKEKKQTTKQNKNQTQGRSDWKTTSTSLGKSSAQTSRSANKTTFLAKL